MSQVHNSTRKKLLLNTLLSLCFEAVAILSGLILPKLIISEYGSEVNGLVNSIAQFLHIISFLDMGVGSVVQSALYKPLAEHNTDETSKIVLSARRFFRKIVLILIVYIAILTVVYPMFVGKNRGWAYVSTLIVAMSISSFAQYYLGIVDKLLLTANQQGYIVYTVAIVVYTVNTMASVIAIHFGASIQVVKALTSLVFLGLPIYMRLYVRKYYTINRKIEYVEEPIKQKWNGISQHISSVVLNSTDNIILTLFSTLENVSIYSVYHLVLYGVKQLFVSTTNGIRAWIGELWAKRDINNLNNVFEIVEWVIHASTVVIFCCTWRLILPFVNIYTARVTDAQYIQPLFATILVLAHAIHCLRIPYNMLILASGAYKDAQNMHMVTAIINIVISVIVVKAYGLVGVAVGTLVAMLYQTIWMIVYDSRNNIHWPIRNVLKQVGFDCLCTAMIVIVTGLIKGNVSNFFQWGILAIVVVIISLIITCCLSIIFYKKQFSGFFKFVLKKHKL